MNILHSIKNNIVFIFFLICMSLLLHITVSSCYIKDVFLKNEPIDKTLYQYEVYQCGKLIDKECLTGEPSSFYEDCFYYKYIGKICLTEEVVSDKSIKHTGEKNEDSLK